MKKNKKDCRKIMMIEPLGDGGIAHYTYNLTQALSKKRERLELFTQRKYEFTHKIMPFKVHKNMFRGFFYLLKIIPLLDKETRIPSFIRRSTKLAEYPLNTLEAMLIMIINKISIVHFQSVTLAELIMIIGSRIINRKVVYTIHNVMPGHQKPQFWQQFLYRIIYFLCHEVIIHSEKGKEQVVDLYKVNQEKIHVIYHGDYKFFIPDKKISKKEAKRNLGIKQDCKTILFFGAIRENKGLRNILFAMPYIKDKISNIVLLIVGEPCEDYRVYRKIIIENQIENEVYEKLAYVSNDEVPLYFFATDLVVLPYNEITQSGVLQLAYAFSKPVVTTDLGGFKEAVDDGKNGYLVQLGDIQGLAEKCTAILTDDEESQKMGNYSRFLSDAKYSWDTIANMTQKVYMKCNGG